MSDAALAPETPPPNAPPPPAPSGDAAPPPAPPTVAGGSASGAKDTPPPEPAKPADPWGPDWRQRIAEHVGAGDKKAVAKELKRLERLTGPEAIYGAYRDLESKFSEGGLTRLPGKDAKPEDIAAFHKALGVPEKPEEYLKNLKLSDNKSLGDADKPIAEAFAAAMHPTGATPQQVSAAVDWYLGVQEQQAAAMDEHDSRTYDETQKVLKEELGSSKDRLLRATHSLFAELPGGTDISNPNSAIAQFFTARLPNGNLVGNDPVMVKALIAWAKNINPIASVTDQGAGDIRSVETELAEIRKVMREDRQRYNKDTSMQARFKELLAAKEQSRTRAA